MRLIVAVWCLASVVFVYSYSSSLASYLMTPKFVPLMNTVEDLVSSNNIQIMVRKFTSEYSELMVSNMRHMKLKRNFIQHKTNLYCHRLQHRVLWQSLVPFLELILETL